MARDLLAGRMGGDAVAFVSTTAALVLGETLAGVIDAAMYAGGNVFALLLPVTAYLGSDYHCATAGRNG